MIEVSEALEREIDRRVADGGYHSPEALIADAFRTMDNTRQAAEQWLVKELLEGLEGEDIEVTPETWGRLEQEALRRADAITRK